jgi:hypothetical protein
MQGRQLGSTSVCTDHTEDYHHVVASVGRKDHLTAPINTSLSLFRHSLPDSSNMKLCTTIRVKLVTAIGRVKDSVFAYIPHINTPPGISVMRIISRYK